MEVCFLGGHVDCRLMPVFVPKGVRKKSDYLTTVLFRVRGHAGDCCDLTLRLHGALSGPVQSIGTSHNDVAAGVRVVVGGGAETKNRLFRARGRSRITAALSTKTWRAACCWGPTDHMDLGTCFAAAEFFDLIPA